MLDKLKNLNGELFWTVSDIHIKIMKHLKYQIRGAIALL